MIQIHNLLYFLPFWFLASCMSSPADKKEQMIPNTNTSKDRTMRDTISKITVPSKKTMTEKEILGRIEGRYFYKEIRTNSTLELSLFVKKNQLSYQLKTNKRNSTGLAKLTIEDDGYIYIILPIEYDSYEGDITSENDKSDKSDKPQEITMRFDPEYHTIDFQNYGNAMNYFVVLDEFGDDKYIQLSKR